MGSVSGASRFLVLARAGWFFALLRVSSRNRVTWTPDGRATPRGGDVVSHDDDRSVVLPFRHGKQERQAVLGQMGVGSASSGAKLAVTAVAVVLVVGALLGFLLIVFR